MANTVIQLKWSELTATPTTLNVAEPAYSNTSGKLFVGGTNQTPILIGGKYYVDRVDEATSANTANVIVKRASDGGLSASYVRAALFGNANTATTLQTGRTIGVTGDVEANSVSFDGSQAITLNLELTNTGVGPGTYGGGSQIPTFAVDVDGRITSAANVSVATNLSIAGDTGTDSLSLISDTLTFVGGDGITSVVDSAGNNVALSVDNTVIRNSGAQSITGDLAVTGNLVVMGTEIVQDVSTVRTEDSLIELSANNAADALDIGFFGTYVNAGTKYTTLFRDASDSGRYKLLTGGTEKPTAGNTVNTQAFSTATLVTNLTGGTVSGLTANIAIADGGTNASAFPTGNLVMFDGTRLVGIANTGISAQTTGAADRTVVVQVDNYGRVVGLTNTAIAISTTQVISGTLPIARGGTNQTTYTTGAMLQFDGTSIGSLANTGTAATYANASHVPVITTDVYGRVSAVTNTAIAIDTSQITSGTLGVARGGSGASSFSMKGVIVSDNASGTGALSALTSATEGHVLQINASGIPTFAHLNGGYF
jgi:trimeric autotransporter adhesin